MAWTTKIIKRVYHLGQDNIEVEIEYTDGRDTLPKTYYVKDLTELKNIARRRIKELDDLKTNFTGIVKGSLDLTPTPKIPPTPPTQQEIDRVNYRKDMKEYRSIETAIEMGILPISGLVPIKIKLQNNYIGSYLDLF